MIKCIFKVILVGIEIIFLVVNDEVENIYMGDRNWEIKDCWFDICRGFIYLINSEIKLIEEYKYFFYFRCIY